MKKRFRILQIMIFVLISLSACQQEESSAEVLVKVGKRSLSYQEFREFFPDRIWDELNHSQKMKFLSRWIDQQVLYQAGLNSNLDQQLSIRRKIEDFESKLIGETYVNQEVSELPDPTDSQLELHYQNHKESYLRMEDQWDYSTIEVKSGKLAWELFEALKSANFSKSLKWIVKNQSYQVKHFKVTKVKGKCLLKTFNKTRLNRISTPVQCNKSYSLIYKSKKYSKGELLPLDLVKNRVKADFLEERSTEIRAEILQKAIAQTQIILNKEMLKEAD